MKCLAIAIFSALSLLLGPSFAQASLADDDRTPLMFTVEIQAESIPRGAEAAIRVEVTNRSASSVTLYSPPIVLHVEGRDGHDTWPIDSSSSHRQYTVGAGKTVYLWGTSDSFYPLTTAQAAPPGTYVLRYCDVVSSEDGPRQVCSKRVHLRIRDSEH